MSNTLVLIETLKDVEQNTVMQAEKGGRTLLYYQTNHEGSLIDRIHQAREEKVDAVIINPAAFTHTSITVRDALSGVAIPFVEVHISNHRSFLSYKAVAVICGLGTYGYTAALEFAMDYLGEKAK
ncbi:3-dehydroquinate dehydratase II [Phaeosphaeriaceae sp. PMI808]|nr:3-dehydroquinate dehydratase II [Phaeosphaeriaceae sp. PMI808]